MKSAIAKQPALVTWSHSQPIRRACAIRSVSEQPSSRRQGGAIDREAVVHGRDLDFSGGEILHRMVRPMMALVHFHRLGADREAQHLVAEADAEGRQT